MKIASRIFAVTSILLALAIVFSPFIAALAGNGMDAHNLAQAFLHGLTRSLGTSVGIAMVSAVASLVLGVPFALLADRASPVLRRIFWALGLLVLVVPPYIVGESWIVLLGPAGKISKPLAMLAGFGPRSTDPFELARYAVPGFVYTWQMVGVIMGGCLFPIISLSVASAFRRTDHRVFESARIARGARGVFEIASRVLMGPAVGAALLVFAITLTEFAVPQLLRVRTIGEAVYEEIQVNNAAAGAALSLPILPLVIIAGATGVLILMRSRLASLAGLEGEVPKFTGRRAGSAGHFAAGMMTFIAVVPAIILPITSLTWLAVTARLPPESAIGSHKVLRASGFLDSLKGATDLAHDDAIRTIVLAGIAATLAVMFAMMLARFASRNGWGPVLGALGAGLAIPAPIVALGLMALWNRDSGMMVYNSPVIVLLAWFARFFPLVVFLVQGAMARVPRELESAAALAGRGPAQRFVAVVLRGAAPGLVAAWLAMYVLSATEFGTTGLIAPQGQPLLAPSVVNLMRRGQDPEIAACQFLLLGVVALPLVVISLGWIVRRSSK